MKRTKRKIFETAVDLFSKKGYESTSVDEITAVVGVAKGTLYYHFESKEEIFKYITETGMDLLRKSINIKTKHATGALDKLRRIIEIQVKITVNYESYVIILLSHIWGNEKRSTDFRKYVLEYISEIREVIDEGIKEGVIRDGDSQLMASNVFGLICGNMIYKLNSEEPLDIKKMTDEMFNYFVNGYGVK